MSEHHDEKDLKLFTSDHKDAVKGGFLANTQFSISVQTSPTSLLVISGYENQESADSNLVAREEWFDKRKGKYIDTFYITRLQFGSIIFYCLLRLKILGRRKIRQRYIRTLKALVQV